MEGDAIDMKELLDILNKVKPEKYLKKGRCVPVLSR